MSRADETDTTSDERAAHERLIRKAPDGSAAEAALLVTYEEEFGEVPSS